MQKQVAEKQFCYFCKKSDTHMPYHDRLDCACSPDLIDVYMCCDCYANIQNDSIKYIQKDINMKLLDPSKIVLDYFDNDINHKTMLMKNVKCTECGTVLDKWFIWDKMEEKKVYIPLRFWFNRN
jgi:hypothetical protein